MGGSSTYGIEQEDGSVIYNIYRDSEFDHYILSEFMKDRIVDIHQEDFYHATSIDDYYSEERYENEDSVIRGLLRLDGVLEYRYWGDRGVFIYKRDKCAN